MQRLRAISDIVRNREWCATADENGTIGGSHVRSLVCHPRHRHHCALWPVFPQVISGLRKPIAIQAAISFNINLQE